MDSLPSPPQLTLHLLPQEYAVSRIETWPHWLPVHGVVSVTRTHQEVSVVCETRYVPQGVLAETGFRAIEFQGPFAFELTGILDSVLNPLAQAKIGVFALSTYNTDYVLVKLTDLPRALLTLTKSGHKIVD